MSQVQKRKIAPVHMSDFETDIAACKHSRTVYSKSLTFVCPPRRASSTLQVPSASYSLEEHIINYWCFLQNAQALCTNENVSLASDFRNYSVSRSDSSISCGPLDNMTTENKSGSRVENVILDYSENLDPRVEPKAVEQPRIIPSNPPMLSLPSNADDANTDTNRGILALATRILRVLHLMRAEINTLREKRIRPVETGLPVDNSDDFILLEELKNTETACDIVS
ncbi:unnamed protein product [Echinostoma caproni]|uniref:Uncharacterized protein n=1 Tax=Echinostoma caproni TaxID=27848 RepID=A0A183B972_9TREM|nr:unnamed protein product [Echinostoma caproni]